jgi:hypothetical protein
MSRMIDQIRASKLPSNMMQFAARGALAVSPAENIEIMVYLARHNPVFGDLARLTLAGWDEKASLAAASDANTAQEVLDYLIAPENLRPKLLPALLENVSVAESEIVKLARSASPEAIAAMLHSPRVRASTEVLDSLQSNPYLKANELDEVKGLLSPVQAGSEAVSPAENESSGEEEGEGAAVEGAKAAAVAEAGEPPQDPIPEESAQAALAADSGGTVSEGSDEAADVPEEVVSAYLAEHAAEIAAEWDKPFQAIGILEILGPDYFPVSAVAEITAGGDSKPPAPAPADDETAGTSPAAPAKAAVHPKAVAPGKKPQVAPRRQNAVQKINNLDVKGRIQLALKGNKEERSILIRDGTKVVALAVLEAPKLSDGEVEKFAGQKNVLEAVLRQIPLRRRFMKNYIVVRNLVFNPRTPIDLSLGLVKYLMVQDLKNLSANKDVSETIRSLGLKMYRQKMDATNKK